MLLERIPRPWRIALVTIAVMASTAASRAGGHHDWLLDAIAIASSAAVAFAGARPVATLAFLTGVSFFLVLGGQPALTAALLWAFGSVGAELPRDKGLRVAAAALAVTALGEAIHHHGGLSGFVPLVVGLAAAWVLGDSVRTRRERTDEDRRRAVADERARIARELHDMVTHNVSVMVVQAAAGNEVFDERPDQARAALRAVEETGRRALGELRRLLDVVADDDDAGYDPQPGLRRLDDLVASVRAAGLGVDLTVEGSPRQLSPALELSAFRIVQEALTNVLKHARASRASVRVRYARDALELEVADDGVGAATIDGGRGLVGMRERAALFGGEIAAGTRPGGGFEVRARMPLEAS
jgi:signal transduction histidine kinase